MEQNIENVELSLLRITDYPAIDRIMKEAFYEVNDPSWEKGQIRKLISSFPDGQVAVKVNGKIAGFALSILVDFDKYGENHNYKEITGNYTFNTHNNDGDTMYGIDVAVKKEYRGLRIGRRLYEYRK
jgi:ribosomal protein S18 acetylase RimI-like enzyme